MTRIWTIKATTPVLFSNYLIIFIVIGILLAALTGIITYCIIKIIKYKKEQKNDR